MSAILGPGARRDIYNVARVIAQDNVSAARRFPRAVAAVARQIGDFPEIGVERPDLASPPYRFAIVPGFPYVAVYDASPRPPVIRRILHGAQDLQDILRTLPRNNA
ncbi:type II toxin-antitoxin system RelE/ParE family toxin [Caulobacter sp. ErkDOM-YI]|uniref:type II toxin-antitoxin system RelE/ParE family toxin n=1 Tax=unclassified Caulobacter TaxID=2648921 RepID=UPI003AF63912